MDNRPWDADYGGGNSLELAGATYRRRPSAAGAVGAGAPGAFAPQEQQRQPRQSPAVYTDLLQRDRLRAVSELPRCFQPLFKEFSFFNSVQSEMLDFVLSTSRSFVVSESLLKSSLPRRPFSVEETVRYTKQKNTAVRAARVVPFIIRRSIAFSFFFCALTSSSLLHSAPMQVPPLEAARRSCSSKSPRRSLLLDDSEPARSRANHRAQPLPPPPFCSLLLSVCLIFPRPSTTTPPHSSPLSLTLGHRIALCSFPG